jgi:phage shock protein A
MTLFRRINDILTANLHDLADRFENPEPMLRQAVREMDDAIAAATGAAARAIAGQKLLDKEIESQRAASERWQRNAAAAVASGDDDLARRALTRRRECERLADVLEDQRTAGQASVERLRRRIEAMKIKRAEAGRLLIELTARHSVAQAHRRLCSIAARDPSSEVFRRFDRLRQRAELAEAEAEAMCELAEEDDWISNRDCQETAQIEADLRMLKERPATL